MKTPSRSKGAVWLVVPTYNERENVDALVASVAAALPEAHVLFVDDSSPDGTADRVKSIQRRRPSVRLLLRPRAVRGRGWAGRDGFIEALRRGAMYVVEMDGDLSHDPSYLPGLLAPLKRGEADLVLGSRYVPGGKDLDRPWYRSLLSRIAKGFLNLVLGLRVNDPTSGYRAYTRGALERLDPGSLRARDPFCVTEILYRARRAGLRVVEAPVVFSDRKRGASKLGPGVLVPYLLRAIRLRLTGRV